MALGLIFIGLILIATGIKGTQKDLASLIASDSTGAGNFWYFIAGIFMLGAVGYYAPLRNTSRLLIVLVLLVFVLTNGGLWQKLVEALGSPQQSAAKAANPAPAPASLQTNSKSIASTFSSGNADVVGGAASAVGMINGIASAATGNISGIGTIVTGLLGIL